MLPGGNKTFCFNYVSPLFSISVDRLRGKAGYEVANMQSSCIQWKDNLSWERIKGP